jgi:hypothetical protein
MKENCCPRSQTARHFENRGRSSSEPNASELPSRREAAGRLTRHANRAGSLELLLIFFCRTRAHRSRFLVWARKHLSANLGKIGLDWHGVEKFWMALPNREKISKVIKK